MPLTNAGRDYFVTAVATGAGTAFNNANSSIGVGDSTATFAASQTDLSAATNKFRKPMDATYPQTASAVLTYRSTFGTGDANFAWNEWGVFNTTSQSGGVMLNRKQEALGTKPGTQTWQFTVTLTFAAA